MKTGYNNLIRNPDPRLARYVPTDDKHLRKFPLTTSQLPDMPVSIAIGVNWYSAFDNPEKDKDGKWWVGKDHTNLGQIRGGHAVCIPFNSRKDSPGWYLFYNQLQEGKCVGEAVSRMMSHHNRKRYDVDFIWNWAKENDEWPETNPGDNNGTSIRAALEGLRLVGHKQHNKPEPDPAHGIQVYRWATNIDDVLTATRNPTYQKLGAMPFLNSWGTGYPRLVWMPCETHARLLNEWGEYGIITDK